VVAVVAIETRARGGGETLAASAVRANAVVFADTGRLEAVGQEDTAGRPTAIASGAGALWVSDAANDRVLRLDPRTHRIEDRIPVGRDPGGLVATPHGVWVVNTGSRTVSEIDPGSGMVVATVAVGNAPKAVWIPLVNSLGIDFGVRVGNFQRHTTFGVPVDQLWVR
jgi:YVTN family beta-propeller protein